MAPDDQPRNQPTARAQGKKSTPDTMAATNVAGQASPTKAAGGKKKAGGAKKKVTQLGDFKLIRKLGQGGMGEVYLAQQVSLDRLVALKTLSRELAKREDFVRRFIREARAMAKIQHPNAVQVYAVDSIGGVNFAAIEFIDGQSMQDWMDQLGKLSVPDAVHVTLMCADALAHAHSMNMIHRDIKPDNILVTKTGVVKVADFGLAKALDDDVSMTQSGTGLGTPLYMAPEQARNAKHVDQRTDIYALGVTLYHFVTGSLPFTGQSTIEVIQAKEAGRFPSARSQNPEVPEKLDLILDKMMAKDAQYRYKSCEEVINDLSALNLESEVLSFAEIEESGGSARTVRRTKSGGGRTTPQPKRAAVAKTSAEDHQAQQHQTAGAEKEWYVRHATPNGKVTISKMKTQAVIKGIKADVLDMKAKAKEGSSGAFVPLGQIPEFADAMAKRAVKEQANAKAKDMKDVYAQLDKQERRRRKFRWVRRLGDGALGWLGLVIYLVVIAAVLFGLYHVVMWAYPMVADKLGLSGPA